MQLPTDQTVRAILQRHRDILGLGELDQVEIVLLGQGEANLNVLVTVNQAQRFNLRIGLRQVESERTLRREYDILQLVPHGIGPQAYALDFSRTQLPEPCMLLDYLDGKVKTVWDITDLEVHARTLAQLHQQKFAQHGAVGQLSDSPYNFLQRFDTGVTYWCLMASSCIAPSCAARGTTRCSWRLALLSQWPAVPGGMAYRLTRRRPTIVAMWKGSSSTCAPASPGGMRRWLSIMRRLRHPFLWRAEIAVC